MEGISPPFRFYAESGTLTMNGGSITANIAIIGQGGGICSDNSGAVDLYGGSITGITATNDLGGGLFALGGMYYAGIYFPITQVTFDGTQVLIKSNKAHLPSPSELSWYQGWGVYFETGTPTTTNGFDPITQVTDNTQI